MKFFSAIATVTTHDAVKYFRCVVSLFWLLVRFLPFRYFFVVVPLSSGKVFESCTNKASDWTTAEATKLFQNSLKRESEKNSSEGKNDNRFLYASLIHSRIDAVDLYHLISLSVEVTFLIYTLRHLLWMSKAIHLTTWNDIKWEYPHWIVSTFVWWNYTWKWMHFWDSSVVFEILFLDARGNVLFGCSDLVSVAALAAVIHFESDAMQSNPISHVISRAR